MTEIEKKEQLDWELQCYGCTSKSIRISLIGSDTDDYKMIVGGLMSDAQEEIEHNDPEGARQTLNRAKFILFNYVMDDSD